MVAASGFSATLFHLPSRGLLAMRAPVPSDGSCGKPSPRAASVPLGLDIHREQQHQRAATPLDIVRDARASLYGSSVVPSSLLQPRMRRAMMLDPTRLPFEEADGAIHCRLPSLSMAMHLPMAAETDGIHCRLPSLSMGMGRSSSSGAASSSAGGSGGGSAPPTRGSQDRALLSPLCLPSPPGTDPPRRLRKKKKGVASTACLIPAMPDSPFPLPPGKTKVPLCERSPNSFKGSPTADEVDDDSGGHADFPLLPMRPALSDSQECGISPLFIVGTCAELLEELDVVRADAADGAAGRPCAAVAAAGDHRACSRESAVSRFTSAADPSAELDLGRLLARSESGGSLRLDMSLNSVLTQKLSNPDCADLAAGPAPEMNVKTCSPVRTKSGGRVQIPEEDLLCPDLPGTGLVRVRSDCDYWDNFSQTGGLSSARSHSKLFDSVDGREVPRLMRQSRSQLSMFSPPQSPKTGFDGLLLRGDFSEVFQSIDRDDVVRGSEFSWVRGELVGRGSLGCVWKALNRENGQLMAVKEVILDTRDKDDAKFRYALQNEVDLYKDLEHPNIVSYLGNDYVKGRLFIYLEYMPGGSIAQVLSQFGPLDEPLVARYTRDLLVGLEYLHTRTPPVLHRDIKGANILVGIESTVKLSDFGCSKRSAGTMVQTLRGSVPWMAPEVMRQSDYGRKADIWSLGCVLIEMSTASPPWGFFDNHLAAMVRIAMSEETPPVPGHLSAALRSMIISCTRRAPEERPSATQLLGHEFLEGCCDRGLGLEDSWG
mmetsp:Transcript_44523/g.142759  ORF Transcript_44523/g.142759 Transcript_44523/m.142759 type:complete len:770 (+) Transcript_44523:107-2416(+)